MCSAIKFVQPRCQLWFSTDLFYPCRIFFFSDFLFLFKFSIESFDFRFEKPKLTWIQEKYLKSARVMCICSLCTAHRYHDQTQTFDSCWHQFRIFGHEVGLTDEQSTCTVFIIVCFVSITMHVDFILIERRKENWRKKENLLTHYRNLYDNMSETFESLGLVPWIVRQTGKLGEYIDATYMFVEI